MKIGQWNLVPLSQEWIPIALRLTEKHLGAGFYTETELHDIIHQAHHYFYIVLDCQTPAGLFYCLAGPEEGLRSRFPWLPRGDGTSCGILKTIVIDEPYRHTGLSDLLVKTFSQMLFLTENVKKIYVLAWLQKDFVPAAFHLARCGFSRGKLISRPWYNDEQLKCPFCGEERCICDGIIFSLEKQ